MLSFKRLFVVILCAIIMMPVASQDGECIDAINEVMLEVEDVCMDLGRNQACYGHTLVEATLVNDARFDVPGDFTELETITSIHTAPYNDETGDWGIVLMNVQANLPDTLPGQNITFLMTGDVTVTDASHSADMMPMRAFYFSTGIGETGCKAAPDSFIIQSPQGAKVNLTVNNIEIELGSTAVFFAEPNEQVEILLVGGEGVITTQGVSQDVPAGEQTTIALGGDDGLTVVSAPTESMPYDPEAIENIPLQLLPQTITVPANSPNWVHTGIMLEAGQSFNIAASGSTNTSSDDQFPKWNVWVPPSGMAVDGDCVGIDIGHDCRCGTMGPEIPACPIPGIPLMALVGRIGNGEPFVIGAGGTFTSQDTGELSLMINDDRFDTNAGELHVLITPFEE